MLKYTELPESLRDGAKNWIEHGIEPGHFLSAVIQNNLVESFKRADNENVNRMLEIVYWWYNEAPSNCWGSKEKFDKWIELHRIVRVLETEK
jgi:hypothetical protein